MELVLSHVATGRDVARAPSRNVTASCPRGLRAKGSPGPPEAGGDVLLEGEAASTEPGPAADRIPRAGDFSAAFVSRAGVERWAVSVLAGAAVAGLAGRGVSGVSELPGRAAGLRGSGLARLSVVRSSCTARGKDG